MPSKHTATKQAVEREDSPQPQPIKLSAIERALKMQEELEQIKQEAIDDLLTQRSTIEDQLKSLGWVNPQSRIETASSYNGARRGPKPGGNPADRFCKICQLKGHDARQHRSQRPNVRAFTQEELAGLNLLPTGGD